MKDTNYNCAEAVFSAAMEAWGLDMPKETVKAMAGFGGGMGCGNVCGAVTGGVAALSCKYVEGDGGRTSPTLMQKVKTYIRLVKTECGLGTVQDAETTVFLKRRAVLSRRFSGLRKCWTVWIRWRLNKNERYCKK